MAKMDVRFTYGELGDEHKLRVEVLQVEDLPAAGSADPNVFVFRSASTGAQYSHVATAGEMERYPNSESGILPKSDEKFFRQSQVILIRGTKDGLEIVRGNVERQLNRLVNQLNAEVVDENPETVNYGGTLGVEPPVEDGDNQDPPE